MEAIELKARRRIKKAIFSSEHQPRVYQSGDVFTYKVKHTRPDSYLLFKLKGNRLYKEKVDKLAAQISHAIVVKGI